MSFFFADKKGDALMGKIRLRDISSRAKQWNHPMRDVFKSAEAIVKNYGDIVNAPKKEREQFGVSLFALALTEDSSNEWWTNIPKEEPPDGLVMTLVKEEKGFMAYMREVEVVEHRGAPEDLVNILKKKMTEYDYGPETVLVCLGLSPNVYDLISLSQEVKAISSSLDHVFMVFPGVAAILSPGSPLPEKVPLRYAMVQLRPIIESITFDMTPHMEDFKKRYDLGQESRLIEGDSIYFATANTIHKEKSPKP